MSIPPDHEIPDLQELLHSLSPHQREHFLTWLDARELSLQAALADSARALSAVSALLAEAVALRNSR